MTIPMGPITNDEYFNVVMSSLPEVKPAKQHTVRQGESLWNIAKHELGEKAKHSDILDYMYKIAKLNRMDTPEKMNSLKVNDQIALPENTKEKPEPQQAQQAQQKAQTAKKENTPQTSPIDKVAPKAVQSKTAPTVQNNESNILSVNWGSMQYKSEWQKRQEQNNVETKPKKAAPKTVAPAQAGKSTPAAAPKKQVTPTTPKTNAELGFEDLKNTLLNTNKNLLLATCGYKGLKQNCYTIYKNSKDNSSNPLAIMTFMTDNKGNLLSIAFNGRKDEFSTRYDYNIDANGQISQSNQYNLKNKNIVKLDPANLKELKSLLEDKAANAEVSEFTISHN